jgi:hypothetical protein
MPSHSTSRKAVPRVISSGQTFLMKWIFPVCWIGAFVITTIFLFQGWDRVFDAPPRPPDYPLLKWIFLVATLVGSGFVYWSAMRLKRVALTDRALVISNYLREITVPLEDVVGVSENRWLNTHPVTIYFRRPTEFGDSIVFMPTVRWFDPFGSHPIVAQLREAMARGKPHR